MNSLRAAPSLCALAVTLSLSLGPFAWPPNAWGGSNEPPGDEAPHGKAGDDKVPGDDKAPGDEAPRDKASNKKGEKNRKPPAEESPSECVKHTIQARFVSGYDHLVHLKNECSRTAVCMVSTDVNPEPQRSTIASGASATVLTFRGSPARTFRAKVDCKLEGAPGKSQ